MIVCSQDSDLNYNSNDIETLVFLYNASDDAISVGFDFLHKIISPSTYQCSLCKITYGNFSMHDDWRNYLNSIPYKIDFLYKNNYKKYHEKLEVNEFPTAFVLKEGKYEIFLSKADFDSCEDLKSLMNLINNKLIDIK